MPTLPEETAVIVCVREYQGFIRHAGWPFHGRIADLQESLERTLFIWRPSTRYIDFNLLLEQPRAMVVALAAWLGVADERKIESAISLVRGGAPRK